MQRVLTPMRSSVATSVDLRPTRSPRYPKITPPSGRARKPIVKVLKDRIFPVNGSASGKKRAGKTRVAAVPYRKKSYHSMGVPMVLATPASINTRREEGGFMGGKRRRGMVSLSVQIWESTMYGFL